MADNPLKKKVGPLEVWQYVTIGTAAGLMYWLYKKKTSEGKEVNPEEEEKLLGALSRAGGGGGEGSIGSSGSNNSLPVPGLEGPKGESGPAGPAGDSGPQGEAPSATLEARVNSLEGELVKNNPPTLTHNGASQTTPKGWSRNDRGELFRTVIKGNGIYHEYRDRNGPAKILKVGERRIPAKKTRRPRPGPVAHRTRVHQAPAKHKTKHVVHR